MIDIEKSVAYDIETICNCFTLNVQALFSDFQTTFEISEFRNDGPLIAQWFEHWRATKTPMIGFNTLGFDYPVLHFIWQNPGCTVWDIYEKAQETIADNTFHKVVWYRDQFAPQIDLFKIYHFDNQAKKTSLKALQVNMRSDRVLEMPLPWATPIAPWDVDKVLIPYNAHDTSETKKFALYSLEAIKFRIGLMETLGGDVLNYNDSKIGSKILEKRLGEDLCYTWENGRREMRQSPRTEIKIADIIFPYVRFSNPEFNRVLDYLRTQTLRPAEFDTSENAKISTKGVFTKLKANVGGIEFCFGTGGMHGSVLSKRFVADEEFAIVDIDVVSLYPSIAIVNKLYPEHLGIRFVEEYARLPLERKEWQKKKGKKCVEANSMKLASNGTYGNSNSAFSVFYDPKYTMTITINGQLLITMLAEFLLTLSSIQLIAVNTDGITYRIRRSEIPAARELQKAWEAYTRLVLEEVEYSHMWIRDVNSYVARSVSGELKQKGAYWYPVRFPEDVSESQPPAWHKDLGNIVSQMAAVEHMVNGKDIEQFITHECDDPYLFCLRAKGDKSTKIMIGDQEVQKITRYYIARDGKPMIKRAPPKGEAGTFKKKNGITDHEFYSILETLPPGTHDSRIHTKNKSVYETRETAVQSGWLVADCSDIRNFSFDNLNYDFYIAEARKLVIDATS